MSDNKNYGQAAAFDEKKRIDEEKTTVGKTPVSDEHPELSFGGALYETKKRNKSRKKLPLVVDIIIAVLMIAMIGGVTVGAYSLFRYYTNDYDVVEIEYVFVTPYEYTAEVYGTMLNREIYCDENGSSLYFGKVTFVELSPESKTVIVTVKADVKYKASEGYSVGECKIAVGGDYLLRSQNISVECTVVELVEKNAGK